MPGRIGRVLFALAFQLVTFLGLYIAVSIVRGHHDGRVYNDGQRVLAAVLGFPAGAAAIGVLLAALYTAATGRRGNLTWRLAGAAVALFVVMYLLELVLK